RSGQRSAKSDRICRMTKMVTATLWLACGTIVWAGKLVNGTLSTPLIPQPLVYSVLLPDGYDAAGAKLPPLPCLPGGGGDNTFLATQQPYIEKMWAAGTLPKMVVVTPSAGRSFYMDRKDGSQKWETAILFALVDHIREQYAVSRDRSRLFLFGISMG